MVAEWLGTTWTQVWLVVVSSVGIFVAVIVAARLNGLRTFSKMSSFDFAMTVAVGSLIAAISVSASSLTNGVIALASIVLVQRILAMGRRHFGIERLVDNTPTVLMLDGEVLEEHLRHTRVTVDDLRAKLREANVLDVSAVRAVVLETTGDISVIHGEQPVDPWLMEGVRGSELIA